MGKEYSTRNCDCTAEAVMGRKRPLHCAHGYTFQTEAELNPSVPKPMQRGEQKRKPQKPLKRTRRRETAAEKKARLNFNAKVKARKCWFAWHRPCERCGGSGETELMSGIRWTCTACNGDGKHHCKGPKDARHLVPKDFIRRMFKAVLPEDQFVALLHNPKLGAPLCRKAHDAIEAGNERIYWEDLTDEAIEYAGSVHDSVLMRLENECPKRSATTAEAAK
jgi:hypothetical protein